MVLPINKSKYVPNTNPKVIPIFLPENNPINKAKITNKLGFIFAIVNQLKKFACKKYIMKNATIKHIIANVPFNLVTV